MRTKASRLKERHFIIKAERIANRHVKRTMPRYTKVKRLWQYSPNDIDANWLWNEFNKGQGEQ